MTDRNEHLYKTVNYLIQTHVYRLPVDIENLCKTYGAYLLPYSTAVEKSVLTWEDIEHMAGTRDGFTLDALGEWAIVYNEKVVENRKRFTLAEELMHRLLLHSQDDDFDVSRQTYTPETYAMYEAEAKRAAGMILVPPTVYYRFHRLYEIGQFAKLCRVSEACAWMCAQDYEKNEEEIRANFTRKHIECNVSDLVRKNPLRPSSVSGESF